MIIIIYIVEPVFGSLLLLFVFVFFKLNISLLAIIFFVIVSKSDHKDYNLYSEVSFRACRSLCRRYSGVSRDRAQSVLVFGLLLPAEFSFASSNRVLGARE